MGWAAAVVLIILIATIGRVMQARYRAMGDAAAGAPTLEARAGAEESAS